MKNGFDPAEYWNAVINKDECAMRAFFREDARVYWPNTGEAFTAEGFIRMNCAYPGEWKGEVERVHRAADDEGLYVAAAHICAADDPSVSFHAVSFITVRGGLIARIDEYWGDDGEPPEWRR